MSKKTAKDKGKAKGGDKGKVIIDDLPDSSPLKRFSAFIKKWPKRCQELSVAYDDFMHKKMQEYLNEVEICKDYLLVGKDRFNYELYPDVLDYVKRKNDPKMCLIPTKIDKFDRNKKLLQANAFLDSMRSSNYYFAEVMVFIGIYFDAGAATTLATMMRSSLFHFRRIEIIDCLLDEKAMMLMSPALNRCLSLRELNFDYNEFGAEGAIQVAKSLYECYNLKSLSLKYCKIGSSAGQYLGKLASKSSIRILLLDGNLLGVEGLANLFLPIVEAFLCDENEHSKAELKKKKVKKGKDLVCPINHQMHVISLSSNEVYILDQQWNYQVDQLFQILEKYVEVANELQSINLFDNELSPLGIQKLMNGLINRKAAKLKKISIEITPHCSSELYDQFLKLASGKAKNKGGKKKK